MSFLAPLYALGILAVSLPIIFHLIQRRPQGEIEFGSLMFLRPSPPRMTRRSRLDHLLLLLLRAAALCLLAAAFTRPLWRSVALRTLPQPQRRTVLLVDTSASMQREDLWQQAVDQVERQLADLQPGDQVALLAFDGTARPLIGFEEINRMEYGERVTAVRTALQNVAPSSEETDLGLALLTSAELLDQAKEGESDGSLPPSIVLITDLQEGSRLNRLSGYQWPPGVRVELQTVAAKSPTNASAVVQKRSSESDAPEDELRVRVFNSADSTRRQFRIGWEGSNDSVHAIDVPPGDSRVVRVLRPESAEARLLLTGDDQPFDNTRYVARLDAVEKTVLYLSNEVEESPTGPLYYLRRAALDTPFQTISVNTHGIGEPLPALSPDVDSLIVVAGALPDDSADALAQYLRDGGRVLAVLTGDSEQHQALTNSLQQLTGVAGLHIEEAQVDDYAMLSKIDFQHPLFQPFADPRFSDFTKIRFWRHRRLTSSDESPWSVLARFDDQAPALVEREFDDGRLWILTAGWQPEDSQLALSSKFVPLLAEMVDSDRARMTLLTDYVVGQHVPVTEAGTQVALPDGALVDLPAGKDFSDTGRPGVYGLVRGTQELRFAVNMAVEESRTAPLDVDALERYGIPMGESHTMEELQARERQMRDVELESRQKLWRSIVVIALVILAAETWLAGRLARRATQGDA